MMILANIFLGTDKRVIPRQMLQSLRVPVFGILHMTSRFVQSIILSLFSVFQASLQINMGSCKDFQMFPILLVKTSVKISEKTTTTPGLAPFQLTVVVFVVGSAFEAKNLPENSLILPSEPLICGTIYEGVYGATQVKQKAIC